MSDSQEVVGIRPADIPVWFKQIGINFTGTLEFARIGLGQSNLTYLVRDTAGAAWVLRRPPLGQLLASAHDVAREAHILSALQSTTVPTPKIYGLVQDPLLTEVPILLMEYVEGAVVDRLATAESLTRSRRRQ